MNGTPCQSGESPEIILVVDHEVRARTTLSEYLRECGYDVIEVGATDQCLMALRWAADRVVAVLCRVDAIGALSASELACQIWAEHAEILVLLAGRLERAANIAGDLCDEVPEIGRPYDPAVVVDEIRHRIAASGGS